MSGGGIEQLILSTIERWWAGRYSERHGLVTSYDPQKYLSKVTFMPEGQESGWLPVETGHIGDGYGIAIGLTPGDGKATGDQVIVRYQEGDFESGKIVQRVHSDKEKPPTVQSGEMAIYTSGKKIVISDNKGNNAVMTFDGKSNITVNISNHTTTATQNVTVTSA
jgi:phage baseplate assembly protein gpV